jgi:hypothetical protein
MLKLTRRKFVELSSSAALGAASTRLSGLSFAPTISSQQGEIRVTDASYSWEYSRESDVFLLHDAKGRLIVSGKMQPAIVVSSGDAAASRLCSLGKPLEPRRNGDRIVFAYEGVNGNGRVSVTWRFDEHGIWTEPVVYESATAQDIVSLHYFAEVKENLPSASLHAGYLVIPGISEASTVSPILRDDVGLDENVWLGRGSSTGGPSQQWGLPVHYFCGFSAGNPDGAARDYFTEYLSAAFACGLADLPGGDLFLHLSGGKSSLWVDYRSDLWHHLHGPGPLKLGATLLWCVAPDYYHAIAGYYQGLLGAGVIHKAQPSEKKIAAALSPQFCTWGSQVDRNKGGARLDEAYLDEIYAELKASGMQARMFSIDDKWEGSYGNLEHSAERLPHFEQFLDQARSEGYKIGVWAALMRCEHPESLGLTTDNVLKKPNGEPFARVNREGKKLYYILDFTQPVVAEILEKVARKFIRTYKPDLLKFDFGYEMPAVSVAGPQDKQWSGERLMWKGLDVLIKAMRQENPDLVVMYYQLSPLFLEYFDLYSPDDLFENSGEYDLEANRRFFFSSLLGQLGIPTYSSSGYDWASVANIWFDAAALGTIGSMNDFRGDERGESGSPELIAKYNGLTHALRSTTAFEITPIDYLLEAPTMAAHPRSWARFEDGQLVLLALRPSIPWETSQLLRPVSDPRITGAVHCDVPIVVASKTKESIAESAHVAIVPYGGGTITLRRKAGKTAEAIFHYFGSSAESKTSISIDNGEMKIVSQERNAAGAPLEWIEVNIT